MVVMRLRLGLFESELLNHLFNESLEVFRSPHWKHRKLQMQKYGFEETYEIFHSFRISRQTFFDHTKLMIFRVRLVLMY